MDWAKTYDEQATCIVFEDVPAVRTPAQPDSERSACVHSIDGHHRSSRNGQVAKMILILRDYEDH